MYADDTTITAAGRSLDDVTNATNCDLHNINQWLLANKLSLNVAKTEHMFIGSYAKLNNLRDTPYIYMNNQPIKRVKSSKSLGVYIDERLTWTEQIDKACKKISSAIGGLKQVRPFIDRDTAIVIYNSLILPIFDYCDIVWDNLPTTQVTRLKNCKTGQPEQ